MANSRRNPNVRQQHAKRPARKAARQRSVVVACADCGTRFQAAYREESYKTPCLTCEHPVVVPGADDDDDAAVSQSKRRSTKRAQGGNGRARNVYREAGKAPQTPRAARPQFPFLSAVSFPWYPETFVRWMYLSAGCSSVVFLYVTIVWCMSMGGVMYRAAYAFLFPFGWLSIWTFSYFSACSTAIISETAGGSDRVSGWPDPDWREWFVEMLGYLPSLAISATVSYGAGKLSEMVDGTFWPTWAATFFLLTPIFLLSAFDAASSITIVTPHVVSSLFRRTWTWLRFYAASAALGLLWPGTLILGYSLEPFYAALVTGPLMAAVLLIYTRLLGRLALLAGR